MEELILEQKRLLEAEKEEALRVLMEAEVITLAEAVGVQMLQEADKAVVLVV